MLNPEEPRRPVWLATAEVPTFETLREGLSVDVVVVGAGICGLTTALLLQRDGARVAVVEANRIGSGTTGGTTGKVTSQHTLIYDTLIRRHGHERAAMYAAANQDAIELITAFAHDTAADCQLERAPAFVYAEDGRHRGAIEAEHEAATQLRLPASLTTDTGLPFPVEIALRFDDQAHFHPVRYVAALARAVAEGGGLVFEHTRALGVEEDAEGAVVHAAGADVRADAVVVATLLPIVDLGGFFAKASPTRSYGVAMTLDEDPPAGMHISAGSPTRSMRPWVDGDRRGMILVGEGHPTGHDDATPGRWGELERWARDRFPVASFDYRWSAQDYLTVDEIPYIGRSPRMDRTLVATGFRKWGLTNATAGARMLADLIAGRSNPWLEAFDATRVGGVETAKKMVSHNAGVAKQFVKGRLDLLRAKPLAGLEPGRAALVELDGDTVAGYRDPGGHLHAVSATCTHMGCTVQWNDAEKSWDCPCHGSRFDPHGEVLDGPAVRSLEQLPADEEAATPDGL